MIEYKECDITSISRGIIVHGVNCQGVMGAGVAQALRDKFPMIFDPYRNETLNHLGKPAELLGRCIVVEVAPELYVVHAYVQENYGRDGRKYVSYDAIDKCFERFMQWRIGKGLEYLNIYFPAIGSGLGGGNWDVIKTIINHRLGKETGYCCIMQRSDPLSQHQNTDTQTSHQ